MFRRLRRVLLLLSVVAVLVGAVVAVTATPALAYGKANWQVTFSATATFPSTGTAFGFWGWCDFAGGVTSGNSGDCEFAEYVHAPAGGGFTCEQSDDLTAWDGTGSDFLISGTATIHPTSLTAPCLLFFPGSASFTGVDSGIPAAAGHYNFGTFLGAVGSFQMQVTQIG